mmetsp:Transcript_6524/g.14413  ORF Transcript_6524/g.14413 Transcript_6524/m.14413 type:complete len:597 (-) Transcript_6524:610-2400(-)
MQFHPHWQYLLVQCKCRMVQSVIRPGYVILLVSSASLPYEKEGGGYRLGQEGEILRAHGRFHNPHVLLIGKELSHLGRPLKQFRIIHYGGIKIGHVGYGGIASMQHCRRFRHVLHLAADVQQHLGAQRADRSLERRRRGDDVEGVPGVDRRDGNDPRLQRREGARHDRLEVGHQVRRGDDRIDGVVGHGRVSSLPVERDGEHFRGAHERSRLRGDGPRGKRRPHVHPEGELGGQVVRGHDALFDHPFHSRAALLGRLEYQSHRSDDFLLDLFQQRRGPEQHGGVPVVSAGVHFVRIVRFESVNVWSGLVDGQGIHVGAQYDARFVRLHCSDVRDDAVSARTGIDVLTSVLRPPRRVLYIQLREDGGDGIGGEGQVVHELGMSMKAPARRLKKGLHGGIVGHFVEGGLEFVRENFAGCAALEESFNDGQRRGCGGHILEGGRYFGGRAANGRFFLLLLFLGIVVGWWRILFFRCIRIIRRLFGSRAEWQRRATMILRCDCNGAREKQRQFHDRWLCCVKSRRDADERRRMEAEGRSKGHRTFCINIRLPKARMLSSDGEAGASCNTLRAACHSISQHLGMPHSHDNIIISSSSPQHR